MRATHLSLLFGTLSALALTGCGSDGSAVATDAAPADGAAVRTDGGADGARSDGNTADAPPSDAAASAAVARGSYLVKTVFNCGSCHTPRDSAGKAIATQLLAGNKCYRDTQPMVDGMGCVASANLTNDDTGIKKLSDDEVVKLIRDGQKPTGKFLLNLMPYYTYHPLTDGDALAIVAYLRSLPPVTNMVTSEPGNPEPDKAQDKVLTLAEIPDPAPGTADLASATRGKYLTSMACISCHTKTVTGMDRPIDVSKAFAGGNTFTAGTGKIDSANLTPDATGLKTWSDMLVARALKQGLDDEDKMLCGPMQFGPNGVYANLTDADALDIAHYLLSLPPVSNTIVNADCPAP